MYKNKINKKIKKKILAKVGDYKLICDGIYHYFTGKELKEVKVRKCWCKNE